MDKLNLKYYETKEWYSKNYNELSKIEEYMKNKFNISNKVTHDTICKMLIYNHHKTDSKHKKNNIFRSFIMYYSVVFFFLFLSIFGKKNEGDIIKSDVSFDLWDTGNHILYDELYNILNKKYNILLLDFTKDNLIRGDVLNNSKSKKAFDKSEHNSFFGKKISFKIAKNLIFQFNSFYKISKKLDYNFIIILLRMIKQIAIYETNVSGIQSKVFISAHDNSFNPLKYYIYKKKINSIFLIQNGYRQGINTNCIHQDCFTYADYYIGFSDENIDLQKGQFQNKLTWGSILIDQEKIRNKNHQKAYDILFVEQFILDCKYGVSEESYEKCIRLLCEFAKTHKKYKIGYRIRRTRTRIENKTLLNNLNKYENLLSGANIIVDSNLKKTSYQAVLESDIIIHYASTLGVEALAFDKKVLALYSDGYEIPAAFSKNDEIGMLIGYDYTKFEKKLLYLLENDNKIITDYYDDKRKIFMNQKDNLHEEICKLVESEINK